MAPTEVAALPAADIDPRSATGLLRVALLKIGKRLPTADKLRVERGQRMLHTPLGRDFTLVTAVGVEFKVHSQWLLGESAALEEYLHPGGIANPSPPTKLNLPEEFRFNAIMINHLVQFFYLNDYFHTKSGTLRHATVIPDGVSITYAVPDLSAAELHLHMYGLSEIFRYPTLQTIAHGKLIEHLVLNTSYKFTPTPAILKSLVDILYADAGDARRICEDADHALQGTIVVSAIMLKLKWWTEEQRNEWDVLIKNDEAFKRDCEVVQEQNKELFEKYERTSKERKETRQERAERRAERKAEWRAGRPELGAQQKLTGQARRAERKVTYRAQALAIRGKMGRDGKEKAHMEASSGDTHAMGKDVKATGENIGAVEEAIKAVEKGVAGMELD